MCRTSRRYEALGARNEPPPPRQHGILHCDARLRSLPNYDPFRCQPPEFICACGRRWVHVCDEAEGCSYVEAGVGLQDVTPAADAGTLTNTTYH